MRIAGHIPHPRYKITLFQMGEKWSVKIEDGMLEQTFSFRKQEGLETLDEFRRKISSQFLQKVAGVFEKMKALRDELLPPEEQEAGFPQII